MRRNHFNLFALKNPTAAKPLGLNIPQALLISANK
jgi:hypothetical protein